jgi:hypothetical protein
MFNLNTVLTYPILATLSIGKKSFENIGRLIKKSGDTIARLLQPASESFEYSQWICKQMFRGKKKLFCIIDDTLIKKIYSTLMQGSGRFFDTKMGRSITAYRLVSCMISDGRYAIPIGCEYLFAKELLDIIDAKCATKDDIAKTFILLAKRLFPDARIIVLCDGLYATVELLTWCTNNKIDIEVRMHSNRKIEYLGEKIALKELAKRSRIRPSRRQMVRTIVARWQGLTLEISIVRRIDKHGKETIVFQAATYKAMPREHAAHYKARWPIEKCFRTCKQTLGLQECFSRVLETQHNHVASVFLAYTLAQLHRKTYKLKTPEEAIRRIKTKKVNCILTQFIRLDAAYQNIVA